MKGFYFISLFFIIAANSLIAQNYIDSLKILPQNPDSSDIVKVVCYATFPSSGCTLDSSEIILGPFEVTINAYYTMGIAAAFCNSIDTITIGKLAVGNYVLFYNSNTNYDTIVEIDSLNFTVVIPNNLPEEKKTKPFVNIYPNPTTGQFTVSSRQGAKVEVYDLFGRLVLRTTEPQIDMGHQPKGFYIVKAGEAVRKLVLN